MEPVKDINDLSEEVISQRKSFSTDRMDISFGEIINMYKDGDLMIRPEYQRLFRWNNVQKTALIESILLNIPIPPLFVAEDKSGKWELIDGLQRVSTIISFFGELKENLTSITYPQTEEELGEDFKNVNKWALGNGDLISGLEDYTFDTLPNNLMLNIKRSVCRVEILRDENPKMKYELFKRLNSGGSKLTPQEIRNAIFRGTSELLNDLLMRASQHDNFIALTRLSEQKKRELYDQELVLRFFAFVDNIDDISENTETSLDNYMADAVNEPNYPSEAQYQRFCSVIDLIYSLNDLNIFRTANNLFVPALFEGILVGVARSVNKYSDNLELLRERVNALKSDEGFKAASGMGSNSRSRVRKRLQRANEIFAE